MSELSCLVLPGLQPASEMGDVERLMQVMCRVPRNVSPRMVKIVQAVCACDMDREFTFGLDSLLCGLAATAS